MSYLDDAENEMYPHHEEPEFNRLMGKDINRREFMIASGVASAAAFLTLAGCHAGVKSGGQAASASGAAMKKPHIGFTPIAASTADTVSVPKGYSARKLISWGDPLFSGAPSFTQKASFEDQLQQFGDNNDGMSFFPLGDDRAVIAINNEYTNKEYLYEHQGKAITADDVKKAKAAHGVSVFEVRKKDGQWHVDVKGIKNRRITADTPMQMTGPAAGHDLLKTNADKEGLTALGTFNNCANGETPWGTYLTCEENFNGYFGSQSDPSLDDRYKRYGISKKDWGYQWYKHDERFDVAKEPNEPHRFGWVVEIDPMDPTSKPKKRTALGRFKHENAALTINDDNHVVVYLGDDERGEHIYKFVSKNKYQPGNNAANRDLLEEGTLYVAKFSGQQGEFKGEGEWLELTFGKNGLTAENGFKSQADVVIFARKAATIVGATTMDRPEWVAVHPGNKHVFCTLTNNKYRGVKDSQPINSPNPREKNPYGHIIRWAPKNGDHLAQTFEWDLFVIAGNPTNQTGLMKGSDNINKENMFNSPDGLGFDGDGRLWVLTDGKYSNKDKFEGMGNNQMLCADPESGEIHRFLTGPIASEVTGLTFTPDYKTMFVGIQHPGEKLAPSHFPDGGNSIPRSTVMVVTKDDGGVIGS